MGREAICDVEFDGKRSQGKVHLETDSLIVRGDLRLTVPFKSLDSAVASGGALRLNWDGLEAVIHLGPQSSTWAWKITNPPGLLDKLGVKSGTFVCLIGLFEKEFRATLVSRGASLLDMREADRADVVFLVAETRDELNRMGPLASVIKKNGAIWVVTPRGRKDLRDIDVMDVGKAAGLVDTKVCRFSDTHTALKFVIPRAKRRKRDEVLE